MATSGVGDVADLLHARGVADLFMSSGVAGPDFMLEGFGWSSQAGEVAQCMCGVLPQEMMMSLQMTGL